jgi:hypothetical protein
MRSIDMVWVMRAFGMGSAPVRQRHIDTCGADSDPSIGSG